MPFINDRLEDNQKAAQAKALQQSVSSGKTLSRFTFDPEAVMAFLRTRIVGQDETLHSVEDMLFRIKADFSEQTRPLCVCLFLGPTGVGKTEIVRLLSQAICGNPDDFCRIDMNTLSQQHYAAALTGAPPGYVGSKEGYTLFNKEQIEGRYSQPGIVLFDEIEKADTDVIRSLLNVIDTGLLRLPAGNQSLNFRNAMIFMTSNLGVEQLDKKAWRNLFKKNSIAASRNRLIVHYQSAMEGFFDPEFINRIDHICYFSHLEASQLEQLVELELDKLSARLQKRGFCLTVSSAVRQHLRNQYDRRYGARAVKRNLRKILEPALAKAVVAYPEDQNFCADLTAEGAVCVVPEKDKK